MISKERIEYTVFDSILCCSQDFEPISDSLGGFILPSSVKRVVSYGTDGPGLGISIELEVLSGTCLELA